MTPTDRTALHKALNSPHYFQHTHLSLPRPLLHALLAALDRAEAERDQLEIDLRMSTGEVWRTTVEERNALRQRAEMAEAELEQAFREGFRAAEHEGFKAAEREAGYGYIEVGAEGKAVAAWRERRAACGLRVFKLQPPPQGSAAQEREDAAFRAGFVFDSQPYIQIITVDDALRIWQKRKNETN